MKRNLPLFLTAFVLVPLAVQAATLGIGDSAPELKASKWVKGEAVEGLRPDQTYVVEFWATWCGPCRSTIPHLTEMARQFTNVVFIGMNVWERGLNPEEKVTRFVGSMGDKMDYRVAMDTTNQFMAKNWMVAAKQNGIPTAFLVHQGKILWIGHPMDRLEETIKAVLAGSFDIETAMKRAEAEKRTESVMDNYFAAVGEDGDPEKAVEYAKQLEALDLQDPRMLNEIAWSILTHGRVKQRDLPLATRLARKALELSEYKEGDILDTYARALFDAGQVAEAIEWQKKAVAASPDDRGIAATLESYLAPPETAE